MTWGEFKARVDERLFEAEYDDTVEVNQIDVHVGPSLRIHIAVAGLMEEDSKTYMSIVGTLP